MTAAVHEAGHAVAAEAVGFHPTRIALSERGGGACFHDAPAPTSSSLAKYLVVMLAGRLAEHIDRGLHLAAFPVRAAFGLECSPNSYWATQADFHAAVVRLFGAVDDDEAELAAYRWLDRELPLAAKEATIILKREWRR